MSHNLSPTVSGGSIGASNPVVDSLSQLSERPNGMIILPWVSNSSTSFSASIVRFTRFTAVRPLVVARIGFKVITAAAGGTNAGADTVQLGLFTASSQTATSGAAWSRVATTGNATLYTTPTGTTTTTLASTGMKWAALTTPYTLTVGRNFFASIAYAYPASANTTNCSIASIGDNLYDALGSTPNVVGIASASASTLPTTMATATYGTANAIAFALAV